ncbi:reverse transcriptase, partial [Klebsiella pneumoniae]|uniref:reverse transcriptase n=1 Tax=Klebsiella pneumoniae TaxID=573 RepID=UPI00210A34AD
MDDILIAAPNDSLGDRVLNDITNALSRFKLVIAQEKIQTVSPWQYLGWQIMERTIRPQKLKIPQTVFSLNDLQKLLGAINWVRPV